MIFRVSTNSERILRIPSKILNIVQTTANMIPLPPRRTQSSASYYTVTMNRSTFSISLENSKFTDLYANDDSQCKMPGWAMLGEWVTQPWIQMIPFYWNKYQHKRPISRCNKMTMRAQKLCTSSQWHTRVPPPQPSPPDESEFLLCRPLCGFVVSEDSSSQNNKQFKSWQWMVRPMIHLGSMSRVKPAHCVSGCWNDVARRFRTRRQLQIYFNFFDRKMVFPHHQFLMRCESKSMQ